MKTLTTMIAIASIAFTARASEPVPYIAMPIDKGYAIDVVKINIYVKHYKPSDAAIVKSAFQGAFSHHKLPVSTWIGVESLAEEGFLIEVDAVAVAEE